MSPGRPVLVAGSTLRGEEQSVIRAFNHLRGRGNNPLLVIAPRHPERFAEVERLCQQEGLLTDPPNGSAHRRRAARRRRGARHDRRAGRGLSDRHRGVRWREPRACGRSQHPRTGAVRQADRVRSLHGELRGDRRGLSRERRGHSGAVRAGSGRCHRCAHGRSGSPCASGRSRASADRSQSRRKRKDDGCDYEPGPSVGWRTRAASSARSVWSIERAQRAVRPCNRASSRVVRPSSSPRAPARSTGHQRRQSRGGGQRQDTRCRGFGEAARRSWRTAFHSEPRIRRAANRPTASSLSATANGCAQGHAVGRRAVHARAVAAARAGIRLSRSLPLRPAGRAPVRLHRPPSGRRVSACAAAARRRARGDRESAPRRTTPAVWLIARTNQRGAGGRRAARQWERRRRRGSDRPARGRTRVQARCRNTMHSEQSAQAVARLSRPAIEEWWHWRALPGPNDSLPRFEGWGGTSCASWCFAITTGSRRATWMRFAAWLRTPTSIW